MSTQSNDERLNEKVAGLTARIDNLEKKTDKLESNTSLLFRLSSMMEQQIDLNRELKKNHDESQKVFKSIDTTLTNLHNGQEKLSEKVDSMGVRIDKVEKKISDIEDVNFEQTRAMELSGKFDMGAFLLKRVPELVLTGIVIALLALLGLKI